MIHNSWDIFHETEKLLNSSPNYLVSNPPNGNISTLRMNKTQEFPSETCSAVESQDFARLVQSIEEYILMFSQKPMILMTKFPLNNLF